MIKNYFKTAWRSLSKNSTYTSINILGLTIGLCACMLVATVVIDDLSYDKQWSHSKDLYRIINFTKMGEGLYDRSDHSPAGLAHLLKTEYPEVEAVSQLYSYKQRLRLSDSDKSGIDFNYLHADTSFWKMLDIKVLKGNPRKFVPGNDNLLITESFRKKYFPKEDPIGKVVHDVPRYGDVSSYQITGVIQDLPSNSVFRSDAILVGTGTTEVLRKNESASFIEQYVLLKKGTNPLQLEAKLNRWYKNFVGKGSSLFQFSFQPLTDVYLHSDFAKGQAVRGDYKTIYIFSGVAILLLIIACVNFINLSTAKAIERVKETGIRKVLGADRSQLVFQFLSESILLFGVAAILATILYQISLPVVEVYLEHRLQQTFVSRFYLFAIAYLVILVLSLLAGFYPAWILSGFKPVYTLKGKMLYKNTSFQNLVRQSLVVLQFSISIVVLISLIVVRQQILFMNHQDLGYDKNNLLSIESIGWDGKGETFKNQLLTLPYVESASISNWLPAQGAGSMSRDVDDPGHPGNKVTLWFINADVDFAKTIGLRLKKGRLLNQNFSSDMLSQDSLMRMNQDEALMASNHQSSLITSYTAKALHINKLDSILPSASNTPVGVIADFHNESLKDPMEPTIILAEKSPAYGGMLVRIKLGNEQRIMNEINGMWGKYFPDKMLEMQWVDDVLQNQYKKEDKLQQMFLFFSSLSMLLAALGIFGLIVQATHVRVKEIGIRKVLGASVKSIVQLFSISFVKLVLLAIIIASPLAAWLMSKWLQDFAYRTEISWWVFALAGGLAVFIALTTISIQSIKAAIANPVKSLRTE